MDVWAWIFGRGRAVLGYCRRVEHTCRLGISACTVPGVYIGGRDRTQDSSRYGNSTHALGEFCHSLGGDDDHGGKCVAFYIHADIRLAEDLRYSSMQNDSEFRTYTIE